MQPYRVNIHIIMHITQLLLYAVFFAVVIDIEEDTEEETEDTVPLSHICQKQRGASRLGVCIMNVAQLLHYFYADLTVVIGTEESPQKRKRKDTSTSAVSVVKL